MPGQALFHIMEILVIVVVLLILLYIFRGQFVNTAGRGIARAIYRIQAHGIEKLPEGGFLLLPNHVSYVDAVVLQLAIPRPVRFLIVDSIYNNKVLNPIFKTMGAFPISASRAKDAISKAAELAASGEIVCIFPEGELTRTGSLLKLKKGFELIARKAGVPVVPVWLDDLWGSVFSYEGGKYFTKWPKRLPYPVTIAFGDAISPEQADVALVRERLLELGEACYRERPMMQTHLAEACIRGCKHYQFRKTLIDGMDDSTLGAGMILAVSITLAKHLRELCPNEKRIAIVLPPGKGGVIANFAVLLAGKVPVNFNFTAGSASIKAATAKGDVTYAITAKKMEARLEGFPWPEHIIYLEKTLPPLKKKILLWRLAVLLLPAKTLASMNHLPDKGGDAEAVLLFTSGSSGEPKGVVLSHRNILGNVSQFGSMLNLGAGDAMLACLPFFHSFGCTVTLWYPLIEGVRIVTFANPLDAAKNISLIEKYNVTMLLATPTFLRGYLRKAEANQLASLRLVVAGAEKLPAELAEKFQEKFGQKILEGYGLTETSPVVSVNLPDPPIAKPGLSVQPANRLGSVGKLAPGIAAQIRSAETGEVLSLHESGMLWLRGVNIFEGYLGEPGKTAEVIEDGWFRTGDLARFDEDGFLFIEGRLSRFSKIGGEMIPHETIEAKIAEALNLAIDDDRAIAITGIPDPAKGEALVLLTTMDIDPTDLRTKLAALGLSNLFIPRIIHKIDAIPLLGSGKLDLKECRDLAIKMTASD